MICEMCVMCDVSDDELCVAFAFQFQPLLFFLVWSEKNKGIYRLTVSTLEQNYTHEIQLYNMRS